MRHYAFLLALLALGPAASLSAQTDDAPSIASLDEPVAALFEGVEGDIDTPARMVAMKVRQILESQESSEAWLELSGALPELAIVGGADIETTFEAARIAEELGGSEPLAAAPVPEPLAAALAPVPLASAVVAPTGTGFAFPDMGGLLDGVAAFTQEMAVTLRDMAVQLGPLDTELAAQALAVLVALYALGMVFFGSASRKARRQRPTRTARVGRPKKGRQREAFALWSDGVPVHEIARRTGLARDAVSVIVHRRAG